MSLLSSFIFNNIGVHPSFLNPLFFGLPFDLCTISKLLSIVYVFRLISIISFKSIYFHTHRGLYRRFLGLRVPIRVLQEAPRLIRSKSSPPSIRRGDALEHFHK